MCSHEELFNHKSIGGEGKKNKLGYNENFCRKKVNLLKKYMLEKYS